MTVRPAVVGPEGALTPEAASVTEPGRGWGVGLFAALASLYFVVGAVLVLRFNMFDPDAPSRVANAGYVVMSRQPHLSAIGFVWNPLPSMVQIPILPFSQWWPELKTHGLAGVLQSALFMAGAAVMVRRIALDRGVGTVWRWLAVGCFALQPMIIVYGASGMSEAAQTFCLLWCVRHLMQWVRFQRVGDLAWAGIALGLCYLCRYEAVPAACGAALLVGAVTFYTARRSQRVNSAILSVIIVLFPLATAFIVWALTSWVVSGELFATLSSQYGNDSQVSAAMERGSPLGEAASSDWVVIAARVLGMQPFALLAVAIAIAHSVLRRKVDALVPISVLGPVLAFAAWGQYTSTTFGWFRFYLLAIPLVICVALALWEPADPTRKHTRWRADNTASRAGAALLCASLAIGLPVTLAATADERIGNQQLQFGLWTLLDPEGYPASEQWYRRLMVNDRALAEYFDRKHLPDGSVLMDTFNTWGIWLASDHPRQFLITSDYDFTAAVNRPWDFGVQYIVASNPTISNADALNLRYPTLWQDGAGLGTLVHSVYGATGDERFRIYRTTGRPANTEPTAEQLSQAGAAGAPDPAETAPETGADRDPARGTPGG
ncbi:ArnT family glycosyltransferase [Mycolicibacterium pulveris]|uniref:ArnT family glycosyltransferase n=1 Tax=Mycolicibacterium pulveris TaxID=36813 RepID=UPI003CF73927